MSVHRGVLHPGGGSPSGQCAGGTHPTGMHSCWFVIYKKKSISVDQSVPPIAEGLFIKIVNLSVESFRENVKSVISDQLQLTNQTMGFVSS